MSTFSVIIISISTICSVRGFGEMALCHDVEDLNLRMLYIAIGIY